ncbi:Copia protein, partial [Mucuna pruriens]
MEAYINANYAGSVSDKRSTTCYYTLLYRNLVIWRSKKQNIVTRSSAETNFKAMVQGICELLWIKIILDDLKIKSESFMKLFCNNKSIINIFIKEKLDNKLITSYIPFGDQLANVLTKGLATKQFNQLICNDQPTIFKDAYHIFTTCEKCQKLGVTITRRHEIPQQLILFYKKYGVVHIVATAYHLQTNRKPKDDLLKTITNVSLLDTFLVLKRCTLAFDKAAKEEKLQLQRKGEMLP